MDKAQDNPAPRVDENVPTTAEKSPEEPPADVETVQDIEAALTRDDGLGGSDEVVMVDINDTEGNDSRGDESEEEKIPQLPLLVDVHWLNFEQFKNRYATDDGVAIIEVLRGHQRMAHEALQESNKRKRQKKWESKLKSTNDKDPNWIQRVRIQSAPLLHILSYLTGHEDGWSPSTPRTFFRPFRTFYYFQPQMKKCLDILEERWAEAEKLESETSEEEPTVTMAQSKGEDLPDNQDNEDNQYNQEKPVNANSKEDGDDIVVDEDISLGEALAGDVVDSVIGLRHLRRYVSFVDEHIMPLWKRAVTQRKVRFLDLWMSFQPGELLYVPPASEATQTPDSTAKAKRRNMYQSAWRLYSLVQDRIKDDTPDDMVVNSNRALDLHCYYIDCNGTSYGPVIHTFEIRDFEGERDITSLEIYPMRFVKDVEKMKSNLRRQGELFRSVMTEKHLCYDGWTLTHEPMGDDDDKQRNSEHIDGDVIIDFVEGYKADSSLSPPSFDGLSNFDDNDWPSGDDMLSIQYWSDRSRTRLLEETKERTQRGEWFGDRLTIQHQKENKFIKAWEADEVPQLEEDDLMLLPRRVVAYALRERKFVMADIQALRKVTSPENIFKDLKIDEHHKKIVKSLVKAHFSKRDIQKQQSTVPLNQDLIRGKGSGLVFLLHGVPGVGKTATAEAVASANKKPLFVITCGDLGFTPKEVETSLREIFRLAQIWDCVLLLDEAEVFLSRRDINDLHRNGLVSVFLRVLEYYNGILFLTTNRVGTLDEAFKSRIHISLYYPPLSLDQTLSIFDVNIEKLHRIELEREKMEQDKIEKERTEREKREKKEKTEKERREKQKEKEKEKTDKEKLDATGKPVPPKESKQATIKIDSSSIRHFASWHYNTHEPHERWNGRQIRSAFQIAYSLAQFDMQRMSIDHWDHDPANDAEAQAADYAIEPSPLLNYAQFQMVATAVENFDDYLYSALAANDMDNARTDGIRADDYDPFHTKNRPVYRPPRPRPQNGNQGPQSRGPPQGAPPPRPRPARAESGRGPPGPGYQPAARQTYQPPQQYSSRKPPPGAVRQGLSRPQARGRGSPLPMTPRPKQQLDPRHDSGYSGSNWSTSSRTPEPEAAQDDAYDAVEEEDENYQDYEEGHEYGYDEYADAGYQAEARY